MANKNILGFNLTGSDTYYSRPYGTCSTAAATAAKTVTWAGFILTTGATILVKFSNANSASSPTLNVNSTGAKTVIYHNAALTSSLYYWSAGDVCEFVYDGTYWVLLNVGNTDTDTWRGVTDSYSGTSTTTSLSQKGANDLYNTLNNKFAYYVPNYISVNNKNMDTIKDPGFYYGYNMTNAAKTDISTFIVNNYSNDWGSQLQLSAGSSRAYIRFWQDAGGIMKDWKTIAFTSDIPTIPASLPANGGNADTVDNKHASDFAPASHSHSYLPLAGGDMNSAAVIKFPNNGAIVQTTNSTSNAVNTINWYKGASKDSTKTYGAQIGWHNTGGSGSGAAYIIPFPQNAEPWGGSVGLYISETKLKFNGTEVSLSGHTHDDRYYTESEVNTKLAGKSDSGHGHETLVQGTIHNIKSAKYNWTLSSGKWYRVMASDSNLVGDATGDLIVYLHNAGSPVTFKLSFGLSYHSYPFLQCNWYTTWSSNQITKARIVYKTSYGNQKAYLELYSAADISHETTFSFKGTGWSFMAPTVTTEEYADSLNSKLEINISADKAVYSHTIAAPKFEGSSTSVLDSGNSSKTTFAYSKSGLNYGDYTWLAGWNGYELRAINKSQFAQASHTHSYLPLSGGVINTTLSTNLPTYSNSPLKFDCTYNNNDNNNSRYRPWFAGEDLVNSYGYGVTASVGIYRDPGYSNGGLYIGCGWDGNANSVMWKFSRGGGLYGSAFYQSSDERLKTFYDPVNIDFDKLKALRKNYFKFNDKDEMQLGVSAQEVQKIYPELVSESDGYLSVAYDKLSVVALAAVDKLHEENKELKERLDKLEKLVEQLIK